MDNDCFSAERGGGDSGCESETAGKREAKETPGTDPPDPRKGSVPDPGKGVRADPVNGGAILEGEGPGPPSGDKERQLSPDKGRGKTGRNEEREHAQSEFTCIAPGESV